MHELIERTRSWPEGLLDQIVVVLRPHLLASGMTEAELDAEIGDIREGFRLELLDRLEKRRAADASIAAGP